MAKSIVLRAATFAVAAFTLCSLAQAQWPARWHPLATSDDEGQVCAVDRFGNVYVAGKTKFNSTNWDFETVKYSSAGVKIWEKQYNGPGDGDDIPTSISVDYDGNVYVGGTSQGQNDVNVNDYDLCVIKYDKDSNIVWPTSGSAGGSFVFDNGAVRSTNTDDEGFNTSDSTVYAVMAVKQDWSPENRLIAISGFTKHTGMVNGSDGWRTIVFQPDSSGQISLKSGWPVNGPHRSTTDDEPKGIAIGSDNSVYVCGHIHDFGAIGGETDYFTTVHFKAAGGNSYANAIVWEDLWQPFDQKGNSATAIVLDRSDNAYVTGWGVSSTLQDYVTVKIEKNADGNGDAVHDWWGAYDGGLNTPGNDVALAIDLTFERESGVVLPFVHVTGKSRSQSNLDDIVTLRYRSDGTSQGSETPVYTVRTNGSANNHDVGLAILGAGRNAYVIGRINRSGTGDDFGIIGYHVDTTPIRFGPVYYDSGNSLFDEGRGGCMVGAGALIATGASRNSNGSGTLLDFASTLNTQTVTTVTPSGYTVNRGSYSSGSVNDLTSSDDTRMEFLEQTSGNLPNIQVTFTATSPAADISEICINYEGQYELGGPQTIEIYDWVSGSWELVDTRTSTLSDSKLILPLKDDAAKYVDTNPLSGTYLQIKARISYKRGVFGSATLKKAKIDVLTFDVIGA